METNSLMFQKTKFTWRINCFNMCAQLPDEPICSPEFSLDSSGETKFSLYVYPRGYSKPDGVLCVYLVGYEPKDRRSDGLVMSIECKLFFDTDMKNSIRSITKRVDFSKINDSIFLEISCIKRSKIIENGKYFTFVNINLVVDFIPIKKILGSSSIWKCTDKDLEDLSCDFSKGLDISKYHDLILRDNGEAHFLVHKSIFMSRYPKLSDTLELEESGSSEYRLCIDKQAVGELLKYIYSGKIEVENVPRGVYKILHSDDLPHLQQLLFPVPETLTASTTVRVRQGYCAWKMPFLYEHSSSLMLSNSMSCDNLFNWTKLRVMCCFRTDDSKDEYIAFTIQRIFPEETIYVACRIQIIGTKYVREYEHLFITEAEWKLPKFISKTLFIAIQRHFMQIEKIPYWGSGILKISFQINISDGRFMSEIISVSCPDVSNQRAKVGENLIALQRDLKYLYENPICSDATLKVEEVKIKVHKIILSLRSPVFNEIFKKTTFENESGEVIIKDFKPNVVKAMLTYIYCGEVDGVRHDTNFVLDLYAIAVEYELPELKEKCALHLKAELSVENIGNILIVAYTHNDVHLKQIVKKFMCANAKAIINSNEWKTVMHERMDLAADVLNDVLGYIKYKKSALKK